MTDDLVRWGILGCSRIASTKVIPALMRAANATVVAVASRTPARAASIAREFGIAQTADGYDDLLSRDDIDVVYISVPNSLHAEWTIRAVEGGKHVLCEKPAAHSMPACVEMTAAAHARSRLFMEGLMYRFHPQHQLVKKTIEAGDIGEVRLIRASFSFPFGSRHSTIRLDGALRGGALLDVGCYTVDVCRWLMGGEPVAAYARLTSSPNVDVDTSCVAVLEFDDDRSGLIDASFSMFRRHRYEVVGSLGMIDVPDAFVPGGSTTVRVITQSGVARVESFEPVDQCQLEVEHFSECVRSGADPFIRPSDSCSNARALDALRASAASDCRVAVHPAVLPSS